MAHLTLFDVFSELASLPATCLDKMSRLEKCLTVAVFSKCLCFCFR